MPGLVSKQRNFKKRVFTQISAPITLHDHGAFYPWAKTATRDAANIGEHIKRKAALDPARLQPVIAAMNDVARRIEALEARRAAPQPMPTQDAPSNPLAGTLVTGATPNGGAVLLGEDARTTFVSPTHRNARGAPDTFEITPTRDGVPRLFPKKAKDAAMTTRNPGLAPNRFITSHAGQRGFNDAAYVAKFGEQPSRFTSQEADRMARHAPGASLPSPAELNAVNRAAHARGASGQMQDNVVAPGGAGGTPGILRRGGMLEAQPSDTSEGFANSLNAVPTGSPPNVSLNLYYGALAKAKSPAARDVINTIWSAYQRR